MLIVKMKTARCFMVDFVTCVEHWFKGKALGLTYPKRILIIILILPISWIKIFTYHSKKNVLWLRNNLKHQYCKSNLMQIFHGCLIRRILIKLLHSFVYRHSWKLSFSGDFRNSSPPRDKSIPLPQTTDRFRKKLALRIDFVRVSQKIQVESVMFLAENLKNAAKREHRIWLVKRKWAKPKPILQTERENKSVYSRNVLSFFLSVKFSLPRKWSCVAVKFVLRTSEVKFAPIFAVRRNFTIRRITSLT